MTQSTNPFDLFAAGHNKEALAQLQAIESSRELSLGEQVLRAELLCSRQEYAPAKLLANQLMSRTDLSGVQRCKLRFALGQWCFHQGNVDKGSEHFRIGAELAARAGRIDEECRLHIQLFRNRTRVVGEHQPGTTDLDALRRKVHQSGSASNALLFQIGLTELATKLSLFSRARHHLETARSLLAQVSNVQLHGKFLHTEAIVTLVEGDTVEALRLALALIEDDKFDAATINLKITIAHLFLMQAEFDEAERWIQRALASSPRGGGREIGILDTMMLIKLLQGDLVEASSWSKSIREALERNHALESSTYGFWHLPTRTQWLFSLGRFDEALDELRSAMPRIASLADRRLLARTKLLMAEGLGRTGQAATGATLIGEALDALQQPALEIVAEAWRVAGGLHATSEPSLALASFNRAEQTLEQLGNKTLADAVRSERNRSSPHTTSETAQGFVAAANWIERIAAILAIGSHPLVLATHIQELLRDAGAVDTVMLAEIDPSSQSKCTVRIALGASRGRHYELQIEPAGTVTGRMALLAIKQIVDNAVELARTRTADREQTALFPSRDRERPLGLICSSERMLELVATVRRVATSDVSVLLLGETGVGKELFAKALHQASQRSDRTFLPFNCSTVPREMVDSQLFGHKRGSFTGAIRDSSGVIRAAAGGTLFLDEIGEMSLESQPKLLRFLESGEILPLGETRPQHVDVRVVAATNANLDELVAEGRFREDLYYRLNVIRLNIPPLRERREEIPALVEHFLERFGRELQKPLLRMADETLEYLVLYRWPGNVRQLGNEIRRLVAMAEAGAVIMPAHLSSDIAESRRTIPTHRSPRLFDEVVTRIDQPLSAAVEHIERAAIQRALAMTDGHLDEAARILGLSRKGLYLKRQRLNLG